MEHVFPWMRPKIGTIYNGVNLELFAPDQPLGNTAHPNTLLALGTVVPKKNAEGLIRALHICRDNHGVQVSVAWAGKAAADGHFEAMDQLVKQLKLESQWEWLGERQNVPDLIREYEAIVHPSFFEGLPNAICEGLASGRPILASDVCDHARLVEDEVRGFLFQPVSPESIAEALLKWHALSSNRRQALGNASRSFAENSLSQSRFVDAYESLFSRLAGNVQDGNASL